MASVEKQLDLLEQELKCVICLSVYEDPHSLPCNHQFCSECISAAFKSKSQCPLCKAPTFKRSIVKNQSLANIILAFHNLRNALAVTYQKPSYASPSKKRVAQSLDDSFSNKRSRREIRTPERKSTEIPKTPPGCMDFSLILEKVPEKFIRSRQTREMGTQTTLVFDPYIRSNNPSNINNTNINNANINNSGKKGKNKDTDNNDNDNKDSGEGIDFGPDLNFNSKISSSSFSPSILRSSRLSSSSISPSRQFDNITDWNSLKQKNSSLSSSSSSSSTPSTPSRAPKNGYPISPNRATNVNSHTPNNRPKPILPGHSTTPTKNSNNANNTNNINNTNTNSINNINNTNTPLQPISNSAVNGKSASRRASSGNDVQNTREKRVQSSKCKNVIVLTTSLDEETNANVKTALKELGGKFVSKYSSDVTHIIAACTNGSHARRTIKVCLGVVEGKWIMTEEWIRASQRERKFIEESPYEVSGDTITAGGPKTAREAVDKKAIPLFNGCLVHLVGDFGSPTKAELKKVLQLGGAEVSCKIPKKLSSSSSSSSVKEFIVCHSTSFSILSPEDSNRIKSLGRPVVESKWILDCVSFYQVLPVAKYELTV